MTKNAILLFILFNLFYYSCSENINNSLESENIQEYHKYILKAERSILCKNFSEAEQFYGTAWNHKQVPFATDIYNRILCNHQLGNKTKLFELLKFLVETTGISINTLKDKYRFLLLHFEEWKTFEKSYSSYIDTHNKNKKTNLAHHTLQIQKLDQKYRESPDRYTTFKQHNITADSINIRELLKLLDEQGYPKNTEIGVLEVNDNIKGFQDVLFIAILHAFQNVKQPFSLEKGKNLVNDLNEQLFQALRIGQLHPEDYIQFLYGKEIHSGNMGVQNFAEPPITIIEGNYYMKPIDYASLDSLNQQRKDLYLEDIETFYAKALFEIKNSDLGFDLLKQGNSVTYHLKNPEQEIFTAQMFGVVPLEFNYGDQFDNFCNN